MSSRARWVHVDINSYFATLLQQENPALRARPMVVVKDHGRTCVIAASKEAKQYGIKTGCSLREARALVPGILAVPAHFDMCLSATYRLKNLLYQLAPEVEIFSLDEAFINLTHCGTLHPDEHVFAELLQTAIKAELGEWVTCNVGLSYNRLLAKLTSEISPKGSITEITAETKDAVLAEVSFADVCGVGFRLAERLALIGVTKPFQINFIPDLELQQHFGPYWSEQLRKIGQGEEPDLLKRSAITLPHMKSIGRSITGYKLCTDELTAQRTLMNLAEEVIAKTRKLGLAGRYAYVSLRGGEGQHWRGHITTQEYLRHLPDFFKLIYHQLYLPQRAQHDWPIIKFSVRLGLLEPWAQTPQLLWPDWHRKEQAHQAVDALNQRFGLFTVHSGTLLNAPLLRPEVTGFLGDKAYQLGRLN